MANVAPVAAITSPTTRPIVAIGSFVDFVATATDPGSQDVLTYDWAFGDGTTRSVATLSRTDATRHAYSAACLCTVTLDVRDPEAAASRQSVDVVVFDPAGKVTGGGSFIADQSGVEVAPGTGYRMNASVQYDAGASLPKGLTDVDIVSAGKSVRATSFDFLVVRGKEATWEGTATVNGTVGYRFRATLVMGSDSITPRRRRSRCGGRAPPGWPVPTCGSPVRSTTARSRPTEIGGKGEAGLRGRARPRSRRCLAFLECGFTAMAPELLERRPQLEALARWWLDATAGDGRLVFVGGEAGIGKTSLVRRFCADLGPPTRVLLGMCEPLATPVPLGPVLDMAGSLPNRFGAVLDGADAPVAVRRAFVEEIGRDRAGTVAVVEDAHWADEATIDLLRYVGRRLDGCPAMVIVTYRDDEVDRAIRSGSFWATWRPCRRSTTCGWPPCPRTP